MKKRRKMKKKRRKMKKKKNPLKFQTFQRQELEQEEIVMKIFFQALFLKKQEEKVNFFEKLEWAKKQKLHSL
jgi:hypothetical protein